MRKMRIIEKITTHPLCIHCDKKYIDEMQMYGNKIVEKEYVNEVCGSCKNQHYKVKITCQGSSEYITKILNKSCIRGILQEHLYESE